MNQIYRKILDDQQSVHQLAELHLIPILTENFLSSEGDLQQQVILLNVLSYVFKL